MMRFLFFVSVCCSLGLSGIAQETVNFSEQLPYFGPQLMMNNLSEWDYFFIDIPETDSIKFRSSQGGEYSIVYHYTISESGRVSQKKTSSFQADTVYLTSTYTYNVHSWDSISVTTVTESIYYDTVRQSSFYFKVDSLEEGWQIKRQATNKKYPFAIITVKRDKERWVLRASSESYTYTFEADNWKEIELDRHCISGHCPADNRLLFNQGLRKNRALRVFGIAQEPPHYSGPRKENYHKREFEILKKYGEGEYSDAQIQALYRFSLNRSGNLKHFWAKAIVDGKWKSFRNKRVKIHYF